MRSVLFLSFVALNVFSCKKKSAVLTQNHDTPKTAFVLTNDTELTGNFRAGQNSIYIRVALEKALMLRAELSAAEGVDSKLEVFDSHLSSVVTIDDVGVSQKEEIYPIYLNTGEALIHIEAAAAKETAFRFFYRTFQPPAGIEKEPNQNLSSATAVEANHASGFYGPQFFYSSDMKDKVRERDCFRFPLNDSSVHQATLELTGVDGVKAHLELFDRDEKSFYEQSASKAGETIVVDAKKIPAGALFFACVRAEETEKNPSRDYYDLTLALKAVHAKSETEPNGKEAEANPVQGESMSGEISSFTDTDFFSWKNTKDYPVVLRTELKTTHPLYLALKQEKRTLNFVQTAHEGEIAENIRVHADETIYFSVQCGKKCAKKKFKPLSYTLAFQDQALSDAMEVEPNDTTKDADTLVDLTQKVGFLNPAGDIDWYQIESEESVLRKVSIQSKIGCRMRLEHFRNRKTVAIASGSANIDYRATLEKNDLLKISCAPLKKPPTDRSYVLTISEEKGK